MLANRREHPAHQRRGALGSGVDDRVRAIAVERLARLEQLREARARIGGGEQRPARVVAGALPKARASSGGWLRRAPRRRRWRSRRHRAARARPAVSTRAGGILPHPRSQRSSPPARRCARPAHGRNRRTRAPGAAREPARASSCRRPSCPRGRYSRLPSTVPLHPGFENSRKKSPGGPGLEDCWVARQRTVSVSLTMRGVTNTSSSVLLSILLVRLKSTPRSGISARNGTLSIVVRVSCW